MDKINILNKIFNNDIIEIIRKHYACIIIQSLFKNNRPLSSLKYGDRVYYLKNSKRIYGSYIAETNNKIYFLPLPRIIPLWKKGNLNFWFDSESNFPYFVPAVYLINKYKIFKLKSWQSEYVSYINNHDRLKFYINKFTII
tara:strand:- start:922 stop:1344 length:423 start_codon:yes stop_codon:yes gene_type:complete